MMLNFDWLSGISLNSAKLIIVFLFIALGVFVYSLKHTYVTEGVSRPRFYHNLKYWAYAIILLIILIYLYF
ncbi:MAG: hypothetical protein ACE5I1_26760 [bacterium]